jgi:hypothetical protein
LSGDPAVVAAIRDGFLGVMVYRPQTITSVQQAVVLPAIAQHYRLVTQLDYRPGQA